MITLSSDFECGNGKNFEKVADNHFRMEVVADKQTGYCGQFCFDVRNDGPAAEVVVEVWEDSRFGGPTNYFACFPTTVWVRPHGLHRFYPLDRSRLQVNEQQRHLVLRLPVAEGQTLRVSQGYLAPYSEICDYLRRFADKRPDRCELFSLGQSVQGREILGLRCGTAGKPKVFCIAGQHPHEFAGMWGMIAIADFMSSLLPQAAALREQIEVHVVPTVNPDGNVMGRSAFNAEDLDMYLAFGDNPDAEQPEAHESKILWRWVTENKPALWVNFHCYTGWKTNSEYPYDGWYEVADYDLFEDPGQRRLYEAICDTMRLETDAPSTHERASIHPQSTLCHQMAKRLGIPHAFYELNLATAGPHGSARRGLNVFKQVVNTLLYMLQETDGTADCR